MSHILLATVFAAALAGALCYVTESPRCEVEAQTRAGRACGLTRRTDSGARYATFLALPYAKQPLAELRFKELQPLEPWKSVFYATKEGPVCPQTDVFYKDLMLARGGMSEACIHANVHASLTIDGKFKHHLPVIVFIHGGGFAFGSGDTDLHGPEYLLRNDVVVITFNYRLNILGFLSLNSASVPGNNGIRDVVTLLRWVRDNARTFGGDPDNVTVAGNSAGAVMAHLLTLTPVANKLFKRAICMSGVATSDFFSSSPIFAATIATQALTLLGIDPLLDPEVIHQLLVAAPIESLMDANKKLLDIYGLTTFVPVVESPHPGVTAVLSKDPEELMRQGVGKDVPLMIGYTSAECGSFIPRFREFDIVDKLNATPALAVTPRLAFMANPLNVSDAIALVHERYLSGADVLGGFVRFCSDAYYAYPALRVARLRDCRAAPHTPRYRFSYSNPKSVIKEGLHVQFAGAGHVEDVTYAFRAASARDPLPRDDRAVVNDITRLFINFATGRRVDPERSAVLSAAADGNRETVLNFFDQVYKVAGAPVVC